MEASRCTDDPFFELDYGNCSTYAPGGINYGFCQEDGACDACGCACADECCIDDPMGYVAASDMNCSDVDALGGWWQCDDLDPDFNGVQNIYVYELCPRSCGRCGSASNMCKNNGDFTASAQIFEGEPTTCQEYNDDWLTKLPASSWDTVTCESMLSTAIHEDETMTVTVASAIREHGFGAACCGSPAKARCFDSTNMCNVDADFDGDVDLGALELGSPGSTCSSTDGNLLVSRLNKLSWADVTCDTLSSTNYTAGGETRTVEQDLMAIGAACCGSLAKARCFGSTNDKNPADDWFQLVLAKDTTQGIRWGTKSEINDEWNLYSYSVVVGPASEAGNFSFAPDGMHLIYQDDPFLGVEYACGNLMVGNGVVLNRQREGLSGRRFVRNEDGSLSPVDAPDPLPNSNPQGDHEICALASAFIPDAEWEWGCSKMTPDNDEDAPPAGWCPEECHVDHYGPNFACSCNAVVTTSDECLAKMSGESPWARAV